MEHVWPFGCRHLAETDRERVLAAKLLQFNKLKTVLCPVCGWDTNGGYIFTVAEDE